MKTAKAGKKKGTDDKVYCVCRQPFDGKSFMVCCCGCGEWFHGKCIGILEKQEPLVRKLEWHCTVCRSKIVTQLQEAVGENLRLETENWNLMLIQIENLKERSTVLKKLNASLKDNSFIPSHNVETNVVSAIQGQEIVQVEAEMVIDRDGDRNGEASGMNCTEREAETVGRDEDRNGEVNGINSQEREAETVGRDGDKNGKVNGMNSQERKVETEEREGDTDVSVVNIQGCREDKINGINNSEQLGDNQLLSQSTTLVVGASQNKSSRSSKKRRKTSLSLNKKRVTQVENSDEDDFDFSPKRIFNLSQLFSVN